MKKQQPKERTKCFLDDLQEIASLFGVELPEQVTNLVEDISSIMRDKNEITIFFNRKSYLKEIIDSWRFSNSIGGLKMSDREITIMITN